MPEQIININFDAIADIARRGVRRTAVFMGLGLNASQDTNFKAYQLSNLQNLGPKLIIRQEFIPTNVDDKTLNHFKEEFGVWVIRNGLRELIETYTVFLDEVHVACLYMGVIRRKFEAEEAKKIDRSFRYEGVDDKLLQLEKRFGVRPKYPEYIGTINRARNCLTHRRGKVGLEDCVDKKTLAVKWVGTDLLAELESSKVIPLDVIGIKMPEAGVVQLKFVERVKDFPLGAVVKFEHHELAEICRFFLDCIGPVIVSSMQYADAIGIPKREQRPLAKEV